MFVALFRFQLFRAECSQFVARMDVIVLSRRLPELFTKCHNFMIHMFLIAMKTRQLWIFKAHVSDIVSCACCVRVEGFVFIW